ncbi:MAG TPA: hypothetical protein VK826_15380 [Bacteroidia bacterium]|nr:hypothetical protein [Bacteroidia bacterium]
MKKLFWIPALILLMAFDVENKEWDLPEPPWTVTHCTPNNHLHKGEGQVEFTFLDSVGHPVTDSVRMSFNGKEKTLWPDKTGKAELGLRGGKYVLVLFLNTLYQEITTDSLMIRDGYTTGIQVNFQPASTLRSTGAFTYKPVLYVYPESTQQVSIQLNVNGELGFTYPQYVNGWNFTADPNGTIHMNEKEYSYLFWDGITYPQVSAADAREGFIVEKDSLVSFFETKLTAMNLTPRERQDFITFWCPIMQEHEKCYVHFLFNEEYDAVASINVTPEPDHMFRMFMLWNDASEVDASSVKDQKMESAVRDGFTIVEWGGAQYSEVTKTLTAK